MSVLVAITLLIASASVSIVLIMQGHWIVGTILAFLMFVCFEYKGYGAKP